MNKNAIRKFATEARRELISRVSQRALKYGISDKEVGNPNDDSVNGHLLSSTEKKQRAALIAQIKEKDMSRLWRRLPTHGLTVSPHCVYGGQWISPYQSACFHR